MLLKQGPDFVPSTEGLKRYQISTFDPAQLSRLCASLEMYDEVGFKDVWAANQALVRYLADQITTIEDLQVIT